MIPADETTRTLLSAREYLYAYVSRAFEREPDVAFVERIASDEAASVCSILGDDSQGCILQGRLAAMANEMSVEALQESYTRSFVGPDRLPASPWESVYASQEHLVFQRTTLQVRDFFRSEGYVGAGYPHEPDDHLGTELAFMAVLAKQAKECFENADLEECERLLGVQSRFLDKHLLRWVESYARDFQHAERTEPFYDTLAQLAALICGEDRQIIEELLG